MNAAPSAPYIPLNLNSFFFWKDYFTLQIIIIMIDSVGTSKTCVENSDFPREFSTNNNAVSCLRFVFIWSLFEAEGKTVKTNEVNSDNSRAKTYFYMENFIKSKWAILSIWHQMVNLWIIWKNREQVKLLIFTYATSCLELVLHWLFLIFDSSRSGNF